MTSPVVVRTALSGYPLVHSGKVRDTYDLGSELLMIATDRISAFDVIMAQGVPGKGSALTQLSRFWFDQTRDLVPNHLITTDIVTLSRLSDTERALLEDRSMIVRKAERIDFECVVRGYLSGSAWSEYQSHGTIAELPMPPGLLESSELTEPIFTPAVKNEAGHDENISVATLRDRIGRELAVELERRSIMLFTVARDLARERGIIIADTKFEFGFVEGQLIVIDEMLTPDSSRFWDLAAYEPGRAQASFDKQFLRDWLIASGWNREPPPPDLPAEVIEGTKQRYQEAVARFTGSSTITVSGSDPERERSGLS